MHFIGYQREGEEEEFCEDIARTGPTVIALTAISPDLRDMAIGVRVVKDTGEEREKANIEAVTVAYYPPKIYHNGTMTFEHNFKDAGRYVGIVTVADDLGNQWVSRFPFTVGVFTFMGYLEYILYGVAFTALCGFLWGHAWATLQTGHYRRAKSCLTYPLRPNSQAVEILGRSGADWISHHPTR